jgi:hypothetical protein
MVVIIVAADKIGVIGVATDIARAAGVIAI